MVNVHTDMEMLIAEAFEAVGKLCFVLQYCNGGDLADYLHSKRQKHSDGRAPSVWLTCVGLLR